MPKFHRETFQQWFADSKRKAKGKVEASQGKVAYFVGCFANYYQPDLARAVVNVLRKNGIEVAVPAHECCGMPMIANKNMTGFRRNAERNIRSLASFIEDGWEVVTSCPSCALMIKREYPSFCSRNEASLMSQHVYYVDEYLFAWAARAGWRATWSGSTSRSSAMFPAISRSRMKARVLWSCCTPSPGLSVAAVNATCCGMGGYHGYRKAYSKLSMEIGRKLFRDIEEADADRVVTGCAACGMQISYGTGIRAIHPVQLLERAYGLDRQGDSGGRQE